MNASIKNGQNGGSDRKIVSFFSAKNEQWRFIPAIVNRVIVLSLINTIMRIGMEQKVYGSESCTQEADFESSRLDPFPVPGISW